MEVQSGMKEIAFYNTKILCIILAGGLSKRMYKSKVFLSFDYNNYFIDSIIKNFVDFGMKKIYISGLIEGYHCIPDIFNKKGPLGGIFSSLYFIYNVNYLDYYVVITSVDVPFINSKLLDFFFINKFNFDIIACYYNFFPIVINFNNNTFNMLLEFFNDEGRYNSIIYFFQKSNFSLVDFSDKKFLYSININNFKKLDKIYDLLF